MPLILGLGAAGGIGYYLYGAGGNAKAAENKFESIHDPFSPSPKSPPVFAAQAITIYRMLTPHPPTGDVDRASARIRDKLPGSSPNAEKNFKGYGQEAGAKIDKAVRFF